jgi:SAM-dependent methyltransferase
MDTDLQLRRVIEQSGYGEPDFAALYDRVRPQPPRALIELVPPLLETDRLRLVVDLGSGTGLSTRVWADPADQVIGIEPNDAMRAFAEAAPATPENVRYEKASSYETGLQDASVDLVTAAQSLQWMDPQRVFPEVGRILRQGGVFCAYNYVAFQTPVWEPEATFGATRQRKNQLRRERGLESASRAQPSRELLEASGVFRHTRELALHSIEQGNGERLLGFALSEGSMRTLLASGTTEEEVGLDRLRDATAALEDPVPWWIVYRVWLGLK